MLLKTRVHNVRRSRHGWLYSLVFASNVSVAAVLLLCVSFLLQPFHEALANETPAEEVVEEVAPVAEAVRDHEPEPSEEVAEDETADAVETEPETKADAVEPVAAEQEEETDIPAETIDDELASNATSTSETEPEADAPEQGEIEIIEIEETSDETTATSSPETTASSTPAVTGAATTTASTTAEVTDVTATTTATSTPDTPTSGDGEAAPVTDTPDPEPPADTPTTTSENNEEPAVATTTPTEPTEDISTATTSNPEVTEPVQFLVTEENYYQFSRQSCVVIGDGTYHCSLNTDPAIDAEAVVYAEQDEDGDMEIYLRTAKGTVEKLSDNTLDDTAPHFDAASLQVVWQRLVEGRYQIITYDLTEQKEMQLTFSRTNNMEPKVSEYGIVWQAWDGNDWEIMYFDGTHTDQLTDNDAQDVAPVIEDGYVLWSVLGETEQEARVYSLDSGELLTITGHEGGAISNPRFVLVYDTKFDNGDVVTQGFDPATGLSAPIAAHPAEEPIDIPDSDSTGETRALIQNKSSQKEELGSDDLVPPPTDTPGATTTATSSETLNLKEATTTPATADPAPATTTADTVAKPLELTDFDLIISSTTSPTDTPAEPATTTASSTQEDHR